VVLKSEAKHLLNLSLTNCLDILIIILIIIIIISVYVFRARQTHRFESMSRCLLCVKLCGDLVWFSI